MGGEGEREEEGLLFVYSNNYRVVGWVCVVHSGCTTPVGELSLFLYIMHGISCSRVGGWLALKMQCSHCSDCASTYTDTGTYRYKPRYRTTTPIILHIHTTPCRSIYIHLTHDRSEYVPAPSHLLTTITTTSTQSTPNGAVGKGKVEGVSIPRTSRSGEWSSYRWDRTMVLM